MTEEPETKKAEAAAPPREPETQATPHDELTVTRAVEEAPVSEPPTVREFFGIPETDSDKGDDHWKSFQERLAEETRGIKWTAAMPELGSKIAELLDIKIHDVLMTAWKKVEAIRQALEESKKNPEKATYLDLAEHSIDYESKPFVDVKIKKLSVKKLTLTVAMNIKVKGFGLKIQNGLIRELQAGKCEAKGNIKFNKLSIAEKKLEPIKFPLTIKVADLIPIAETSPKELVAPEKAPTDAGDHVERIEL